MKNISDTQVIAIADTIQKDSMTRDHAIFVALAMQFSAESEEFKREYGTFGVVQLCQAAALLCGE